jgi:hypothetical protein
MMLAARRWSARNWFLLLLPALVAVGYLVSRSAPGGPQLERVLLLDALVSVPLLYFLCYRGTLTRGHMTLRLVALACAGVWLAAKLVPPSSQELLPYLGWARMAGLAVIFLFEVRLVVLAVRMAFAGRSDSAQLSAATGAPLWLAKLMLMEARFWRWLWALISRR